jgi:hypothetical protein
MGSSRIIFSNGLLDPWHTSGILESLSDSLIAIVIPGNKNVNNDMNKKTVKKVMKNDLNNILK